MQAQLSTLAILSFCAPVLASCLDKREIPGGITKAPYTTPPNIRKRELDTCGFVDGNLGIKYTSPVDIPLLISLE